MSDNDDFWKNINGMYDKMFPKDSQIRKLMDQQQKFREQFGNQMPHVNEQYKHLIQKPSQIKELANLSTPQNESLKKSMELVREINSQNSNSNFNYYQKTIREIFDNMNKINNLNVSKQLNQVRKQFGYPGENLNKSQQENVNRFNSDFASYESDNSFSESPNVKDDGTNSDNLDSSSHSKDSSNVESKENMTNVPAEEKEVSNEHHVVNDAIKKKFSYMLSNKIFNQTNVPLWTFIFSILGNSIDLPNESLETYVLHCLDDVCVSLITYYGSQNAKK